MPLPSLGMSQDGQDTRHIHGCRLKWRGVVRTPNACSSPQRLEVPYQGKSRGIGTRDTYCTATKESPGREYDGRSVLSIRFGEVNLPRFGSSTAQLLSAATAINQSS